jgi:hypothetical protein
MASAVMATVAFASAALTNVEAPKSRHARHTCEPGHGEFMESLQNSFWGMMAFTGATTLGLNSDPKIFLTP